MVLQMGPHQGRVEGKENLPWPTGHTPLNASQDPIGLLGNQGTLLDSQMSKNSMGNIRGLDNKMKEKEEGWM